MNQRAMLAPAAIDDARAKLLAADAAWAEAAGGDDIDKLLEYWADDAIIDLGGPAPTVVGKGAIREFITRNRQSPAFSITWRATDAWVSADGSSGCTMGQGVITRATPAGEVITIRNPYCCVWRLENGAWRCALDFTIPDLGSTE